MAEPRVLLLDIEMSPNIVYAWRIFQQYVTPDQIVEPARPICWAAKWSGEKKVFFSSIHGDGRFAMIEAIYQLLDEADIVIHFNGTSFDLPWLNGEFLLAGYTPPSPYKQIDLLTTVRKQFNFPSTKLGYLAEQLGLEGKVKHEGLKLWKDCLDGDEKAWQKMEKYNKRDVTLLEEMYALLRPWVPNHPNMALLNGKHGCPACGSRALVIRKYGYTSVGKFVQYRCSDCGKYSRDTHRVDGADITAVTI
jgi:DNA-directed RNA polymerase subunit RPC12/RpoP